MPAVPSSVEGMCEFLAASRPSKTYPVPTLFDCSPAEQRWATALIQFNMEPARYAHQSWLPAWSSHASEQLLSRLSVELLASHKLESIFDWKMAVPASRLFMMDRAALERMALIMGIASHRNRLRQIVFKPHLEALRAALGDTVDTLWMPFAESLPRSSIRLAIQWNPLDIDGLTAELRNAGYLHLLQLLEPSRPEHHAAAMRAAFCVSREVAKAERPAVDDEQSLRASNTLINEVIPHWAPAWTWLF